MGHIVLPVELFIEQHQTAFFSEQEERSVTDWRGLCQVKLQGSPETSYKVELCIKNEENIATTIVNKHILS